MRKILSAAVVALAAFVLLLSPSGLVNAQSNGLGINPRKDITVQPGETVSDKLYISNLDSNQDLILTLEVIDFSAADETGTPALKLQANAPQTPWSLKPFINLPKTIKVKAGKVEYPAFSVTVPKGQGAGSYYSAVRYVAQGDEGSGNLALTASGATLVFVTVPGQTKESLTLNNFGPYDGKYKTMFSKSQPLQMAYTLKNTGNVAEQPSGSIQIKGGFGTSITIKDANPKSSLALIEQTRRFETCIVGQQQGEDSNADIKCVKPGLTPGRYTATLSLFYGINGNTNQEVMTTVTFWYLPLWFILVVLLIIALIALGIFLVVRKVRGGGSGFKRKH